MFSVASFIDQTQTLRGAVLASYVTTWRSRSLAIKVNADL